MKATDSRQRTVPVTCATRARTISPGSLTGLARTVHTTRTAAGRPGGGEGGGRAGGRGRGAGGTRLSDWRAAGGAAGGGRPKGKSPPPQQAPSIRRANVPPRIAQLAPARRRPPPAAPAWLQ